MTYRMQILLDDQSRQGLLWLTDVENKSASRVVRELVVEKMRTKRQAVKKMSVVEALRKTARAARRLGPSSGPADFAKKHNEYLY